MAAGGFDKKKATTTFLKALQPAALELHLAAAADVEEQRQQLHRQWQQRIERINYQGRACGPSVPTGRTRKPLGRP